MSGSIIVQFVVSNLDNPDEKSTEVELPFSKATIKELLSWKIQKDVEDFNSSLEHDEMPNLIDTKIKEMEKEGKIALPKKKKRIDPKKAISDGLREFKKQHYILFLDDEQFTKLSDVVSLKGVKTIKIIKMIPLVGG